MIQRIVKTFFKFCCAIGLFLGLQQLIERQTRGFCIERIRAQDLPFHADWQTPPLSTETEKTVDELLSQSYTFLGAGSECFAFLSADESTVIKFFKLDLLRPVYIHRGIFLEDYSSYAGTLSDLSYAREESNSFFDKALKRLFGMREYRLLRTFTSLKLAYTQLKEEAGLLYLHLNPTEHLQRSLTLYDSCGIAHTIDLDTAKFFLQKKAVPIETHLAALKQEENHAAAKECIDSLLQLILVRCTKGFADRDIVDRNLGFIGTQAIEIDSGSFLENERMREPFVYRQELFYGTLELKSWLQEEYPELLPYLEETVTERIRDI